MDSFREKMKEVLDKMFGSPQGLQCTKTFQNRITLRGEFLFLNKFLRDDKGKKSLVIFLKYLETGYSDWLDEIQSHPLFTNHM